MHNMSLGSEDAQRRTSTTWRHAFHDVFVLMRTKIGMGIFCFLIDNRQSTISDPFVNGHRSDPVSQHVATMMAGYVPVEVWCIRRRRTKAACTTDPGSFYQHRQLLHFPCVSIAIHGDGIGLSVLLPLKVTSNLSCMRPTFRLVPVHPLFSGFFMFYITANASFRLLFFLLPFHTISFSQLIL